MSKRINAIITALITMLIFNTSVLASPSTNDSETSQVKVDNTLQTNQVQNKSNGPINVQIQNLDISVEKLDNQIEQALKDIDDNNNKITSTESDIKNLQEQINEAESAIKDYKTILNKRTRAFYINGIDGYMEVMMDSKNLDDFLSRMDSIKRVMSFDQQVISGLNEKKQNIVNKKEKLQEENKKLLILKADNEKKLAKLNGDKEDEKKLIEQLQFQQKTVELNNSTNYNSSNMNNANIGNENTASNSLTSNNLKNNSLPSSNNTIIAYAYKFLGTPYLWGGTTPDGFDCSGFMQYVYAHFGTKIGRTTYEQIKDGIEVQKDKLSPGDLVFFGTEDNPHHVGMYIGNGMYIHAPHTGDIIKVSVLADRNDYLTARRVR